VAKPDITRLLIDSALQPELRRRLAETPDAVFEQYDLTAEERELLRHPDQRLLPVLGAALQRDGQTHPPFSNPVPLAIDSQLLPDTQMALTVVPCLIGERISFATWISPLPENGDPSRLPPPVGATLPGTPLAPLYAVINLSAARAKDANGDLRVNMWASFRQNSNAAAPRPELPANDSPEVKAAADAVLAAAPEERYEKLAALVRALRDGDSR
jgi:hypothetical protein